ncbi:MAG: hypothetical protein P8R39_03925 [Alphaproteobacteria bacterium]|nr:hypothetical protein [Alphaproteobacteria bacterium]
MTTKPPSPVRAALAHLGVPESPAMAAARELPNQWKPIHFMHQLGLNPENPQHVEAVHAFADLVVLEQMRADASALPDPSVWMQTHTTEHKHRLLFDTCVSSAQGLALIASDVIDALASLEAEVSCYNPLFYSGAGRAAMVAMRHHCGLVLTERPWKFIIEGTPTQRDATRRLGKALRQLGLQRQLKLHPTKWPILPLQSLLRNPHASGAQSIEALQFDFATMRMDTVGIGIEGWFKDDVRIQAMRESYSRMARLLGLLASIKEPAASVPEGVYFKLRSIVRRARPGTWVYEIPSESGWPADADKPSQAVNALSGVRSARRASPENMQNLAFHWKGRRTTWPDPTGSASLTVNEYRARVGFGDNSSGCPTAEHNGSFGTLYIPLRELCFQLDLQAKKPPNTNTGEGRKTFAFTINVDNVTSSVLHPNDIVFESGGSPRTFSARIRFMKMGPLTATTGLTESTESTEQYIQWNVDRVTQLLSFAHGIASEVVNSRQASGEEVPADKNVIPAVHLTLDGIASDNRVHWKMIAALAAVVGQQQCYGFTPTYITIANDNNPADTTQIQKYEARFNDADHGMPLSEIVAAHVLIHSPDPPYLG